MDDVNPMRGRAARDAMRKRTMVSAADHGEFWRVSVSVRDLLGLLDIADEADCPSPPAAQDPVLPVADGFDRATEGWIAHDRALETVTELGAQFAAMDRRLGRVEAAVLGLCRAWEVEP